jgi:beta-lactam-binding protein with PASTA domain
VVAQCTVPKLTGKKLKAAKKSLAKADCKLGKVKGHKTKSAKVKKQSPKPGKVLPPGAKVNVKLAS